MGTIVMYIFVNKDLNMTKGKTCSQVAHLTQTIVEEIIRTGYETYPVPESYFTYMKWRTNCTKIILGASEEQLKEIIKWPESRYIIDDGQTQVNPGSLTCVGFPPNSKMKEIVKDYKLL